MPLSGKTALVTGSGRGIGEGIAHVLAERGAAIVVNDLHADRAQTVVDAIASKGFSATASIFDVSDYAAVVAATERIEQEVAPIDILVNNAGIPEDRHTGPFAESDPAHWKPFIDLNVYGAMNCVRAVLPRMIERGFGRIVQISSGAAARGLPLGSGESVYGGSKAYMDGLIRHLSIEVAQSGVTVNSVAPGLIGAAALVYADPDVVEKVLERVPMGRFGEPRELGDAVAWLASPDAAYVTGQVIHVNGGSYQGR